MGEPSVTILIHSTTLITLDDASNAMHGAAIAIDGGRIAAAQLDSQGIAPLYTTPEEFGRIGRADREKWRPIAQLANRASQ